MRSEQSFQIFVTFFVTIWITQLSLSLTAHSVFWRQRIPK